MLTVCARDINTLFMAFGKGSIGVASLSLKYRLVCVAGGGNSEGEKPPDDDSEVLPGYDGRHIERQGGLKVAPSSCVLNIRPLICTARTER